jgi:fibronectin type 3 domain-containing protein
MSRQFAYALVALAMAATLVAGSVMAQQAPADDRIGLAEEFDSTEGWEYFEGDQYESMKSVDGRLVIDTWVGSFGGAKPPEQPLQQGANSSIHKTFQTEVDFDKYHYLVMKTDEKSMHSMLYVKKAGADRNYATQVNYTTGIIAQDLRHIGLTGKGKLDIELEIMNNGRVFKADYIRLVSELTDEEKAALVPPPVGVYEENIKGHLYQRLEALNGRSARLPQRQPNETVMFRDVGTGAITFKMTSNPADQGFSEHYQAWRSDGSGFYTIPGGRDYYSYEAQGLTRSPANPYDRKYDSQGYKGEDRKHSLVRRWDEKAGKWETLGLVPSNSVWFGGDRMVTRDGATLKVYDMTAADPLAQPREIEVPYADGKGNSLSDDGKFFTYFGPWGTYQKIVVDLDTGKNWRGSQLTFTHGMHGDPWSLMSYGTLAKLLVPSGIGLGEDKPGEKLKLYGPFQNEVATDYGQMSRDGRYGFTNGIRGELDGQHVALDTSDAGTILRLATYNVSKITWRIWTKSLPSPDYTKLIYISDMLGDGDFYVAVTRRPDAPRALSAETTDGGIKLSWQAPQRNREFAGYAIYRSTQSGRGFAPIRDELVTETSFVDPDAPKDGPVYYLVAGRERSGIEGDFSNEVSVRAGDAPRRLHFEAETLQRTLPMRHVFDGYASGFYAVRVTPVAEGEDKTPGTLTLNASMLPAGEYTVWIRGRSPKGAGKLSIGRGDNAEATVELKGADWAWRKAQGTLAVQVVDGRQQPILLSSDVDGLAIDKIVLTTDTDYKPADADDRLAAPQPVENLKVVKTDANNVELAWDPPAGPKPWFYMVYVGDKPDFAIGNETALVRTFEPTATDRAIPAGKTYHYKVVAVDHRFGMSTPAAVEAKTEPAERKTIELPAAKAKLGDGLTKATDEDIDYVTAEAGKSGDLTFEFDAPAGTYYLWLEYGVRSAKNRTLTLALDGEKIGTWEGREPTRMGRDLDPKVAKVRWFVDRVIWSPQRYKTEMSMQLDAGKHTLTITGLGDAQPWISKVWLTSDPTLVPPGYSSQVRFNRDRRQK